MAVHDLPTSREAPLVAATLVLLFTLVAWLAIAAWIASGSRTRDEEREMSIQRLIVSVREFRAEYGTVPSQAYGLRGWHAAPGLLGLVDYRPLDRDRFTVTTYFEGTHGMAHPTASDGWVRHKAGLVTLTFDARP